VERHAVKFWILVTAVIGYHVPDVWDFLRIWAKFRPEYPFTIFVMTTSPGWLFFRPRLLVGLTNALVYGVVAYAIAVGAKKLAARRSQQR
jgi:hypothetical protein